MTDVPLRAPELITTARLVARRLAPGDEPRFLTLHRDREVVYWLDPDNPDEITEAENHEWLERHLRRWRDEGFGLYAVFEREAVGERIDETRFVGRAALTTVPDDVAELVDAPGAVELGYAFARAAWGRGYAGEIGRRLLEVARDDLGLGEVVAYTMVENVRSRRVLERLGFVYDREFVHDGVPDVFYRRAT